MASRSEQIHPAVRILMLLFTSVAVLAIPRWSGIVVFACALVALSAVMRVSASRLRRLLLPAAPFVVMAVLFGALDYDAQLGLVVSGEGALNALLVGARLVLLFGASAVFCLTSTSSQQMEGLRTLLQPLSRLGVPVDDVATTLSLALRFIPLTLDTLQTIRVAQRCRGAQLDSGSVGARLKANAACFAPLFIGMFRRANTIAEAMDARGYGLGPQRSALIEQKISAKSVAALLLGAAFCVLCVLI